MEPNWAEQVTAIASALGAIGIAIAVLALRAQERDRDRQAAAEMSRRWGSPELVFARQLTDTHTTKTLKAAVQHYKNRNDILYYALLREPDFFEDIGIAVKRRTVSFSYILDALGSAIMDRWDLWAPTIATVWGDDPTIYENFRGVARKIRDYLEICDSIEAARAAEYRKGYGF